MTHYGKVILILPSIMWSNEGVEQGVVVKLDSSSLGRWCEESVAERPPTAYDMIEFFPIVAATFRWNDSPPLTGPYTILSQENLTIEDISHLITAKTFSVWKNDCFLSKRTVESLESVRFAIVHRYSSPTERNGELQARSTELIDYVGACLALIRPTRRSRAMHIRGVMRSDGAFDPYGFNALEDVADVPEIQKLFAVREQDINLLIAVLPEFMQLYQKERNGKLTDDYEPLRMAVQLYGQAYSLSYWKARHILWWSAIESLYGNSEDDAVARIYSFFGDTNLVNGHNCAIYEKGDIPSYMYAVPGSLHTLGKMVPLIYKVRNASAHGQKVPDSHFARFLIHSVKV